MPAVSECHGASLISQDNGAWLKCAACQQPCEGISDEQDDTFPIGDTLNAEIDARKIQKLVDTGVISREDLDHAPIIHVDTPPMQFPRPTGPGKILKVTCQWGGICHMEFPNLTEFEDHVAHDHLGFRPMTGDS